MVADEDEVWVVGDVAMGTLADNLPLVGLLRGRKRLMAGNHDRCWAGKKGWEKWVDRYLEAGFEEIVQGPVETRIGSRQVIVSHFPYAGDSQDRDRLTEQRPVDRGSWLLHGHVHEKWRTRDRMINVGVDVWDFRPVRSDVLADLMENGRRSGRER